MVFVSLYLKNLSKRYGGARSSTDVAAAPDVGRPASLRLAAIDGRRIGRVAIAEYNPAPRRRKALRLVTVDGARLG